MRAAVLPGIDEKLIVTDRAELADPGPGQVRVRLAASGVCHTDLSAQDGTKPRTPMPCCLGHEGAGTVTALGPGVSGLAEGDHVVLSWIPSCGVCRFCAGGQPNLCMWIYGMMDPAKSPLTLDGKPLPPGVGAFPTFCEETVAFEASAIKIPEEVPLDVASLLGCGVMTGVGAALNTADIVPGSNVLVLGCGGVGINVIQGAAVAGASEIVAVDLSDAKLEAARRFGATHAVKPDDLPDVVRDVTGGIGFDTTFEVVGRPETIKQAWELVRRGGISVIVGVGKAGDSVGFDAFELSFFEKQVRGCVYGSANVRRDFDRLLTLWKTGRLDLEGLISRRIDLEDVNDAFDWLRDGSDVIRSLIVF